MPALSRFRGTRRVTGHVSGPTFLRMVRARNRSQQGDLGEASAMQWLTHVGGLVLVPLGHSPDYDLIADLNGRLLRVQVKTSVQEIRTPNGHLRHPVSLVTCGGNQSWTGVSKLIDPDSIDYLFVLTGSGRRWFIPAGELGGSRAIQLGGDKYSEFEVEVGPPIRAVVCGGARLESAHPGEYPSGQRTAAVNRQALPSEVRILPPPSEPGGASRPSVGRTRISSNHQLTIPRGPFEQADLQIGDGFRVEAVGPGQLTLTRLSEFAAAHEAQLRLGTE